MQDGDTRHEAQHTQADDPTNATRVGCCTVARKHQNNAAGRCRALAPVLRLLCPAGLCQLAQVPTARRHVWGPLRPRALHGHFVGQQWDGNARIRTLPCHDFEQQDAVRIHITGLAHVARQEQPAGIGGNMGTGAAT